jgi:acyl-CoA thioesterase FadM
VPSESVQLSDVAPDTVDFQTKQLTKRDSRVHHECDSDDEILFLSMQATHVSVSNTTRIMVRAIEPRIEPYGELHPPAGT